MILRFNKKTKRLVKRISKKVAKKLKVNKATLCIATDDQANFEHRCSEKIVCICFETDVDDVWAELEVPATEWFDIIGELKRFMDNPNVEWCKSK